MSLLKLDLVLYNLLNEKEKKKYNDFFAKDNDGKFVNTLVYDDNNKYINFKGKNEDNLNMLEIMYLDELKVSIMKDIVSANIMKKIKFNKIIKNYGMPKNKNIDF